MSDELILVDLFDRETGSGEKLAVHRNRQLHRAFSVFIRDGSGRLLLQRRARGKYHSGGLWANACCSHPRKGESLLPAACRRLGEELGVPVQETDLRELFSFVYYAPFGRLSEYEYDHVLLLTHGGPFSPDPGEIEELRWISPEALMEELSRTPEHFCAWFLTAAPRVLSILKEEGLADGQKEQP